MPYPNGADRVNLPPDRRHSIHLPPLCPSANHVPVLPWRDAVYAAWSRLSHTFSVPGPVAVPKRWPRSSGWAPTTWLETTIAEECGCPERVSLPSPRSDADTHDTAAIPSYPANSLGTHSADSKTHLASVVPIDALGRSPHSGIEHRTPSSSEDSLPFPHTRYWGLVSQADTHLTGFMRSMSARAKFVSISILNLWISLRQSRRS